MLQTARTILFAYAALLVVGGVAGYANKGSVISLVAGGVCGVLSLAAAILLTNNPTLGLTLGGVATLLVGGNMARSFVKTGHLWPAGITLAASLLTLIVIVAAFFAARTAGPR